MSVRAELARLGLRWLMKPGTAQSPLKVKFTNFQQITRSRTGQTQIGSRGELEQLGNALLEPL